MPAEGKKGLKVELVVGWITIHSGKRCRREDGRGGKGKEVKNTAGQAKQVTKREVRKTEPGEPEGRKRSPGKENPKEKVKGAETTFRGGKTKDSEKVNWTEKKKAFPTFPEGKKGFREVGAEKWGGRLTGS